MFMDFQGLKAEWNRIVLRYESPFTRLIGEIKSDFIYAGSIFHAVINKHVLIINMYISITTEKISNSIM